MIRGLELVPQTGVVAGQVPLPEGSMYLSLVEYELSEAMKGFQAISINYLKALVTTVVSTAWVYGPLFLHGLNRRRIQLATTRTARKNPVADLGSARKFSEFEGGTSNNSWQATQLTKNYDARFASRPPNMIKNPKP